jgi:hypothetical protein
MTSNGITPEPASICDESFGRFSSWASGSYTWATDWHDSEAGSWPTGAARNWRLLLCEYDLVFPVFRDDDKHAIVETYLDSLD